MNGRINSRLQFRFGELALHPSNARLLVLFSRFPIDRPTNYSRRALSPGDASRAMTARYRRQVLMSLVHQLSYRPLGEVSNIGVTEAGWRFSDDAAPTPHQPRTNPGSLDTSTPLSLLRRGTPAPQHPPPYPIVVAALPSSDIQQSSLQLSFRSRERRGRYPSLSFSRSIFILQRSTSRHYRRRVDASTPLVHVDISASRAGEHRAQTVRTIEFFIRCF